MLTFPARVIGFALLAGVACRSPLADNPGARASLTFTRDVAPILFQHCAPCHRPGQMAPFSVLQYEHVKPHARQIAAATVRRSMPPWLPEPGYGTFSNERRLSEDQIQAIRRWAQEGAVEGDRRDLPPTPTWPEGWQLGEPDLVLSLPEPYVLQAGGPDVFRVFVVPIHVDSTRYVAGWEFRPGNAKVVHHATLQLDPTRSSRRLDAEDPEPGYEGMFAEGVYSPGGHFLGWTPGMAPLVEAQDMAWRLEPGTDLVMLLHMLPTGKPEVIQPSVGLFFGDTPPLRSPIMFRLGSKTIDIPAGEKDYAITDTYVLPVDVEVLSVYPHAHHLAKEMKALATLPDGTVEWLIWITGWNFNWQDVYKYARPIRLPKGTTITMEYVYDNSADNPRNPHRPPQRVTFGPRSTDEMGDLWLQLTSQRTADLAVLVRDNFQRELRHDIAAAEQFVRTAPDAERHNLLAVRYLQVGRVEEARAHLEEALRLKPQYAEAHSNLGSLLQAQGRLGEAIDQFRRALRLNPDDAHVHFNLGNALAASGRVKEAVDHFRHAVAITPDSFETHNNLAVALGTLGRVEEAMRHLRLALELNPDYADAHSNLGLALASAGKRDEAIRHLQRALEIRPDHADAQQNLRLLTQAK